MNVSFIRDDVDHFGTKGNTLAGVGDVNNDGFDDIVIGVSQEDDDRFTQNRLDPNFKNFAGYTYLYFGRSNQKWKLNMSRSEANASFVGESDNDYSGAALAGVGDVNNDGFADFVIGAWGNNEGAADAGKTYLILGKETSRWQKDISLTEANASFTGEFLDDYSGYALAGVGDVNNDEYDEFLIGAPNFAENKAGKTYFILGRSTNDWQKDTSLSTSLSFQSDSPNDNFGSSLAGVGDVNNDGYNDFIIGANRHNSKRGKVYLVLGGTNVANNFSFSFVGENNEDRAGFHLAGAGDVNNDGLDDFLISAPYFQSDRGITYLIYGKPNLVKQSQKTGFSDNLFFIILPIFLIKKLKKRR